MDDEYAKWRESEKVFAQQRRDQLAKDATERMQKAIERQEAAPPNPMYNYLYVEKEIKALQQQAGDDAVLIESLRQRIVRNEEQIRCKQGELAVLHEEVAAFLSTTS